MPPILVALTLAMGAFPVEAARHAGTTPIDPAAAAVVAAPASRAGRVAANTVVILELVDGISSKTNLRGEKFNLRLAEPIRLGDQVLVPAGTAVVGEILHAQKASGGGRAGELTIAARYIDAPSGPIKLRSSVGSAGASHTQAALATSFIAGPFAMMVQGSDRILPAGSRISSKTAVDIDVDAAGNLTVAPPATSPTLPPQGNATP